MKKILIAVIVIIIAVLIAFLATPLKNFLPREILPAQTPEPTKLPTETLTVDNTILTVEVANDDTERTQGLSDRTGLAPDSGMLFVFDKIGFYGFWMKDMHFPLDIVWIGSDKKIVDITPNLSPQTYPQTFTPQDPAQYVLEIPAGYAKEHSIKIGDVTRFN